MSSSVAPRPTVIPRLASDLNAATLSSILSAHTGSKLTVADDGVKTGEMGGTNVNDYYNSEINKMEVRTEEGPTFSIIVKVPQSERLHRIMSRVARVLSKEVFWYTVALPELSAANPALKSACAECYFGASNYISDDIFLRPSLARRSCCLPVWMITEPAEKGFLLLENVTATQSFIMADKRLILDVPYIKAAVSSLAHFHGAWWQFLHAKDEGSRPKTSFTLDDFKTVYMQKPPVKAFAHMMRHTLKSLLELVRNRKSEFSDPEAIVARMEKYVREDRLVKALERRIEDVSKSSSLFNTMLHGDFWSNNVLFRTSTVDGEERIDAKVIDFQMSWVGHPAIDLNHLFYSNTDKAFRKDHFKDCMKAYFDVFSKYLTPPASDVGFEDFFKEFEAFRDVALFNAVTGMANNLSPNPFSLKKFSDFLRLREKLHAELATPDKDDDHPMIREIRRRFTDIIKEHVEQGII